MNTSNDAVQCVENFIAAVNDRNAEAAQSFAHPDLEMHFSGGVCFDSAAEFFEWLQQRTPESHYDYDTVHVVQSGADHIVYASGTARGVLASGQTFANVRVLDRFLIRAGKILKKEAWSDMGDFLRANT